MSEWFDAVRKRTKDEDEAVGSRCVNNKMGEKDVEEVRTNCPIRALEISTCPDEGVSSMADDGKHAACRARGDDTGADTDTDEVADTEVEGRASLTGGREAELDGMVEEEEDGGAEKETDGVGDDDGDGVGVVDEDGVAVEVAVAVAEVVDDGVGDEVGELDGGGVRRGRNELCGNDR